MDLLSIGSPPAQTPSSTLDMLSPAQDNKHTIDMLSTLTSPSAHATPPAVISPMMDLLDGFGPSPSVPGMTSSLCIWSEDCAPSLINDLLSITETNGPTYPSVVAFESSTLKMTFNFSKEPGSPQTTLIEAQFENKSPNTYSNFVFQAAVPKVILRVQLSLLYTTRYGVRSLCAVILNIDLCFCVGLHEPDLHCLILVYVCLLQTLFNVYLMKMG